MPVSPEVLSDIDKFKVLRAVVSLDAVSMVNVLAASKRSSENRFHDKAMLGHVAPSATDVHISIARLNKPSPAPLVVVGSDVLSPLLDGLT